MKAQPGKTYAIIQDERVHSLFTETELPEWNEKHVPTVDVTGRVPGVGDIYNVGTDTFAAYTPPPLTSEQLAEQAIRAEKDSARADARIQAFLAKDANQHKADVAKIINIDDAKQIIADMVIMLSVLVKKEFMK